MNLALPELEKFLPQGEAARHTPLRAVREGAWQRVESPAPYKGRLVIAAGQTASVVADWPLPGTNTFTARALQVVVEQGASLTLLEETDGDGWAADTLDISLADGATLTHAVINSARGIVTRQEKISLADNAAYTRLALQTGSPLARLDVALTLGAKNTVNLSGLNLCGGGQVLDQTTLLTLNGPGNKCSVQQRNAIGAGGHSVFQGKYFVAREAQQTDGYMLVKNLLLADTAQAFGKPELEIYADDVKCSHGASTGGLNPEQLFYLKSRGVDDATARQLIVAGFVEELLTGWPDEILSAAQPVAHAWLAGLAQ